MDLMNDQQGFEQLSEMAWGFQPSRIFLTAVELDVFGCIGHGAVEASAVASNLGTDLRATEILLNALAGLGLLSKSQGKFANTDLTLKYLVTRGPDYALTGLKHTANLWRAWSNLTDIVRTGEVVRTAMSDDEAKESTQSFIMLMHERAKYRAPKVAKSLDLSSVTSVLDIGGGPGTHSMEFAKQNPALCAVVFDLPEVVGIADGLIKQAGLQDRVTIRPGDYYVDDFGQGYDLAFLSAIIHSNSPEGNMQILKKAYNALLPGGRVAIVDFIMDDEKTKPEFGAVFAVNMLVATDAGNCYSQKEIEGWFTQTGFLNSSVKYEIDEDISLMTAIKP
jgi:SAM-dependent methyltransferase